MYCSALAAASIYAPLLEFAQPLLVALNLLRCLLRVLLAVLERGVDVLELNPGAGWHFEPLQIVHVVPHGFMSTSARKTGEPILGILRQTINTLGPLDDSAGLQRCHFSDTAKIALSTFEAGSQKYTGKFARQ